MRQLAYYIGIVIRCYLNKHKLDHFKLAGQYTSYNLIEQFTDISVFTSVYLFVENLNEHTPTTSTKDAHSTVETLNSPLPIGGRQTCKHAGHYEFALQVADHSVQILRFITLKQTTNYSKEVA